MIVKGKDVIGLNVVTIDDGTKIETVDDIAYDPTNHQIVALLVDSGGLFSSAKAILMDDVRNIGEDAVIVPTASVIRPLKELADGVRSISESNKHLVTTNVLTIDGKQLGRVTDIFFDSANGMVESMEVSQGGLKTMTEGKKSIKPADIVTIGADATIVSAYTEQKLEAQGEENGLKGALNDAKEKIEQASDNVRETAKDVSEKVSEKSQEIARDTREKAEDFRDDASKKIGELRDNADDTIADMRRNGRQIKEDVQERTDEAVEKTRKVVDDTVENAKEKGKELHGKAKQDWDSRTDSANTAHHSGGEVVEKTAKHYENDETVIDEKRTIVKK